MSTTSIRRAARRAARLGLAASFLAGSGLLAACGPDPVRTTTEQTTTTTTAPAPVLPPPTSTQTTTTHTQGY